MHYKLDCAPPSYWLLLLAGFMLLGVPACDSGQTNREPSAAFSIENENPRAGGDVTFIADASDPENKIDTLSWTFEGKNVTYEGDAGGEIVTHAFPQKGRYEAELTVRDDIGSTAKASKTIDVRLRYSKVTLTMTEVRRFSDWPYDSSADLYYVLSDSSADLHTSDKYADFSPNQVPVSFEGVDLDLSNLSATHTLSFRADNGSGTDDVLKELEFDFDDNIACRIETTLCYPSAEGADPDYKVLTAPPDSAAIIWLHLNWGN